MKTLLRTKELSVRLGVTPKTIREWVRAGKIPCYRGSQRPLLFDADEVFAALRGPGQREGGAE